MRQTFIINDLHLGVKRSSGTTKATVKALSEWQMSKFSDLLKLAEKKDLLINGDLFDRFEVDKSIEFEVFTHLHRWMQFNPDQYLYLCAGNHDLSTNSERTSSFENLCGYLSVVDTRQQLKVVAGNTALHIPNAFTIVAHHANQTLFDEALNTVLANHTDIKYVFLHANLMSPFAEHSDHSLNVSEQQLQTFEDKGVTLVFAHEHNRRRFKNAIVIGNQIPTSVSDCLDPNPSKQYAVLDDLGLNTFDFITLSDVFAKIPWTADTIPEPLFLRVEGEAEYEQAAEVVQLLAEIRRSSDAFVVTNAVQVGKLNMTENVPNPTEHLNVLNLVLDNLPTHLHTRFKEVVNYA
ncbi:MULTISPECIES: metallophosphoesterase [Neisseria]|nr:MULTISPECIES: metallophosphoesterase [Neisseria]